MKQKASKMLRKITFYTLYVPCVLLDAICKDVSELFVKAKIGMKLLWEDVKVIFANRTLLLESVKADLSVVFSRSTDRKVQKTSGNKCKKAKVKTPLSKKMFVSTATMVVSAILLIAVSYGQYRIMIPGEIRMPEAAEFKQTAFIYPTLDNYDGEPKDIETTEAAGTTYDSHGLSGKDYAADSYYGKTYASEVSDSELIYNMYLDDLQPGDDVRSIISHYQGKTPDERQTDSYLLSHSFQLELQNSDKNGKINQVPSHYTISISSLGILNLEMILVDNDAPDTYYYGVRNNSSNTYTFHKITNNSSHPITTVGSDITYENNATVFHFINLTKENAQNTDLDDWNNVETDYKKSYTVFVGWNNSYPYTNDSNQDNHLRTANANASVNSRKEVELLNIKVTATGDYLDKYPDGTVYDGFIFKENGNTTWINSPMEDQIKKALRQKRNTPRASLAAAQNGTAYVDGNYPGEVLVKSGVASEQSEEVSE